MDAHLCASKYMARTYVKTKRAELEADTHRRLIEAAVELHREVGPIATTVSMIAERAGVQRHTVYAHFADQRALLMACSGSHLEHVPPPDPATWVHLTDSTARLTTGLSELYAWFGRDEQMFANVLRDAEEDALLREITALRFGAPIAAIATSLGEGIGPMGRAMLGVAMSFFAWRALAAQLEPKDRVALMVKAIVTADIPSK